MQTASHGTGDRIAGRDSATVSPALLDIRQLSAKGLGSTRHIRRLVDSGRMPAPVRLGSLLRWRIETGDPMTGIDDWIAAGCPSVRQHGRTGR